MLHDRHAGPFPSEEIPGTRDLQHLFDFVWDRTAERERSALAVGDRDDAEFTRNTLRMLAGLRRLLDGQSIGSSACEGYLRAVAWSCANHPDFRADWLL